MDAQNDLILAADIGGTNARFGCLEREPDGTWKVSHFVKVRGSEYPSFEEALGDYLSKLDVKPAQAALSAAGPVEAGFINLTNTDWQISAERLKQLFGFKTCGLYNDFAGMTRSIPEIPKDNLHVVRAGHARKNAPILVAGPGTGFGVGYLIPIKRGWHVLTTEGGHQAYAPRSAREMELLTVLRRSYEFVSLELVSSGKGLPVVHKAVCEMHDVDYEHMPPKEVSDRALAGDSVCLDVCEIRSAATMGAIGDLTLSGGARGGVVLAGGVSERMIDFFIKPQAMNRYLNRGPQSAYVKDIPIHLLKSPLAPLIGSASLLEDAEA